MSPIPPPLRRVPMVLATIVVVATLLGPALGASAAKTTSKSTTTTTASHECTATQLLFVGPVPFSPQTGEHGFTMTITNVSTHSCQVHGYPTLRFYTSAGRLLTFTYSHRGNDYFRRTTPRLVNLAPRSHAYFVVAKYRCDLRDRYIARFFYVLPLYTAGSPWVGHLSGSGVTQMDYCAGSSRGPGQTVQVSPVVSSLSQLTP